MIRLAIVSSHPIQYNAPVFRALAARDDFDVHVFFSWEGTQQHLDVEFGRTITWDIPLTDGYDHTFVPNVARDPGTHHFMGLRNPNMCKEVGDFEPDAVLVYGWSSWTHLTVLRHFKSRVPVIFRGDSTLISSDRRWKALFRKRALSWIYRHVDRALYVGKRNRDYFLAHGVPESRLSWAPHSIENDRFAKDQADLQAKADAERTALGIPSDAVTFLFAGKLVERKQAALLVKSFIDLASTPLAPDAHLVIVGTGPLEADLREIAAGRRDVHFLGFKNQSEMPVAYRIGDVLVLPSSRETWGLSVNEAMACSRAVIVSDRVGCEPDLAANPDFSSVFEDRSPASLHRSLRKWQVKGRGAALQAGERAAKFIAGWSTGAAVEAIARAISEEVSNA